MPSRQQALFDAYPELFYYARETSPQGNVYPIAFGIACEDGWFQLLDNLCSSLSQYIKNKELAPVRVIQIKEKFGSLRFYVNGADPYCSGMIHFAETMAACICETCGAPGSPGHLVGCYQTLCTDCRGPVSPESPASPESTSAR